MQGGDIMASIKDIAKACGVSVATVSKALNGHNDISQATKEKVREAARQIEISACITPISFRRTLIA